MASRRGGKGLAGQSRRGPASPRRSWRLQNRRGAMFALVAMMLVIIVGMAAVAIDMGRLYVGTAELQTAADASALVGAQALQTATSNKEVVVPAAVAAFAPSNMVFKTPMTAAELEVRPKFWTPGVNGAPGSATNAAWSAANAVEVSARRQSTYLLGKIFQQVAPQLNRPATAWVASIVGAQCLRPWSFPMTSVLSRAGDDGDGELSMTELEKFNALSEFERTIRVTPPPKTGQPTPTPPGEDGHWDPLTWKVPNNGMSGYIQNVKDPTSCSGIMVGIDSIYDHPSGAIDDKTTEAVTGSLNKNKPPEEGAPRVCNFSGNSSTCIDPETGGIGVTELVVFGTTSYQNGKESIRVDMIAEFTLLCYQRGGNDTCESERYLDMTGQPQGTMVGYIHPNLRKMSKDLVLGNAPSVGNVLVLVR